MRGERSLTLETADKLARGVVAESGALGRSRETDNEQPPEALTLFEMVLYAAKPSKGIIA
jgi:hypothetical protein